MLIAHEIRLRAGSPAAFDGLTIAATKAIFITTNGRRCCQAAIEVVNKLRPDIVMM